MYFATTTNIPQKTYSIGYHIGILFLLGGLISCQEKHKPSKTIAKSANNLDTGININGFHFQSISPLNLRDSTASDTLFKDWDIHMAEWPIFKGKVDLSSMDVELQISEKMALVVSDEGTLCELSNWNTQSSNWESIEITSSGQFEVPITVSKESSWTGEFDTTSFREAVKRECPEKYYPLIVNVKQANEYPVSSGIIQKTVRFNYRVKGDKKWKSRFLIFNIALGC